MDSTKKTVPSNVSISKRYKFRNKNKKVEVKYITQLLNTADLPVEQKSYIENRYLDALFSLDSLAIQNKYIYNIARGIVLIIGILIPAIINMNESIIDEKSSKLLVTIISVISSILFGVLQIWKQDKMWAHHRVQFELMRSNLYRYLTLSGEIYSKYESHTKAYKQFVSISEDNFDSEILSYFNSLQLDMKTKELIDTHIK